MEYDTDKIDDVALAVLAVTLGADNRAWKGIAWEITDRLFEKGLIENPRNKNASMVFTEQGRARAEALMAKLFSKQD